MNDVEEEALAVVVAAALADEIGDAIAGLGARLDQLEAARRDLLTPVANIPDTEGLSHDD